MHELSREAFIDRVMSVSYVASAPEDVRREVLREVETLLETDPELVGRDELVMPYRTDVFWTTRR